MTPKRPELILSMASLDADTRRLMSGSVQASLLKLGFQWSNGRNEVQHTQREALRVFTPGWDCKDITYADGPQSCDGAAIYFDATQVSEFLGFAEKFLATNLTTQFRRQVV
jgi:hypothetical protein